LGTGTAGKNSRLTAIQIKAIVGIADGVHQFRNYNYRTD